MFNIRRVLYGFIALSIVFAAMPANAQTQLGQIAGRVTDSTGAVVPNAKVEVTNPAIGVARETTSNNEGLYTFPYLQYGTYKVTVSRTGFAPFVVEAVDVVAATTTTVDASLVVGGTSAQVTVQANAIAIETTSSTVATTVEEKLKDDVPNLISGSMRSAYSYVYLSPAVNPYGQPTIGGGRNSSQETLVDGQTLDINTYVMGNSGGGMPSVEAIGEYKMLTNSMSAEYGRSAGGETTFATKSGTNQYHGVGYWYLRNQVLDARAWQALNRGQYKQNEFGFAGGGPVWIPKIYNGTNKTFFWANVTGFKLRQAAPSAVLSLPTAAMRSGDFSAKDLNPIYDSTNLLTDANGQTQRTQFSCNGRINVICPDRISPISKFFLDKLPLPNLTGSSNNFVGTSNNSNDNWDLTVKGDQYLGTRSRISGFFQFSHPSQGIGSVLGNLFGATVYSYYYRPRLDWSYNIKPNLINQVLLGFTRYRDNSTSNNTGMNIGKQAGIAGTFSGDCPEIWFNQPDWYICGNTALGGHPSDQHGNLITTINETLMWSHGAHTIKAGMQYIHWNENFRLYGATTHNSATGEYQFNNAATANAQGTGGEQWASFALGYPSQVTMNAPGIFGVRQSYWGLFVQDDWKLTSRLTLNLGLRWDIDVPYTEVHSQVTSVDPKLPNPGAGNLPGALSFYGVGAGRNGITRPGDIHWKNIGPRLGFAYQIDSKTVFRGFWGIVYQGAQTSNADFADRTGFVASGSPLPNSNPFGRYYSWDTPYPQNVLGTIPNFDPAFRNNQAGLMQSPQGIGRAPSLYMLSTSLQRQVKYNIVLEASYLGNVAKHANDKLQMGELEPQYWNLGALLNQPLNSPQVQALGYKAPYLGFNTSLPLYRALVPFPQYNGLTDNASTWSGSNYQAGIFKAQKRFSAGLTFLANYTVSKFISMMSYSPGQYGSTPRDAYNFSLSKALQRFDMPQRLVLSYSYELPFGPGKRFASGANPIVKQLVGGWTVSAIQTYESGVPLVASGTLNTSIPTVSSRSNRAAGVPVQSGLGCSSMVFGNASKNYLFNAGNPTQAARTGRPQAYFDEGAYGFGNAPTVEPNARQCPNMDEDISIFKTFFVRENVHIRFGTDMFNLLNRHTWISGPLFGSTITASNFGEITPYQIAGPRQIQLKLRIEF